MYESERNTLTEYFSRAAELRARASALLCKAAQEYHAVSEECYQIEKELDKLNRAYRAYCKKHNITAAPRYC